MAERQFTEEQVAEIIRSAAEHQGRFGKTAGRAASVSESEVRRIAHELGIEPGALQRALDRIGIWRSSDTGSIQSVERTLERTFDAVIPEEGLAALAEDFVPGTVGNAGVRVGSSLTYSAMVGMAQCQVSVAKKSDQTTLRVRSNASLAAVLTFVPAFAFTLLSGALVWDGLTTTTLAKAVIHGVVTLLIWGGATAGFRIWVRNTNRKIAALLDRTCRAFADSIGDLRSNLGQARAPVEETEPDQERLEQQ